MSSKIKIFINQIFNQLSLHIINGEISKPSFGHIKTDSSLRIEGVRIILVQHISHIWNSKVIISNRCSDEQFHKHNLSAIRILVIGRINNISTPGVVIIEHNSQFANFVTVNSTYILNLIGRINPHRFNSSKLGSLNIVNNDRFAPVIAIIRGNGNPDFGSISIGSH